jgi:hypothetical protein
MKHRVEIHLEMEDIERLLVLSGFAIAILNNDRESLKEFTTIVQNITPEQVLSTIDKMNFAVETVLNMREQKT